MTAAQIDKASNVLKLSFTGEVKVTEARQALQEIKRLVGELQPGFRLLTDLTGLASMEQECVPEISKTMDLLNQKGVSLVVRVIPDPHKDIGFNIMSLFHYRHGLRIVTCDTIKQAEQVLAG